MLRCSVGRGKKTSSVRPLMVYWPGAGRSGTPARRGAAVDGVLAGAGQERDPRDRGLALAGRAVAGARSEVDRDRGDRLVGDLVGVARGRPVVVGAFAALGGSDAT